MQSKLILKAIITTLFVPGMVILILPYLIIHPSGLMEWPALSITKIVVTLVVIVALTILLHSIWAFAFYGRGTLTPLDPPRILVICGPYRYARNPMYLSIVCILLAEAWFFSNVSMLIYTVLVFLGFHLFVIYYEEPRLRSQFGAAYKQYTNQVPRWGVTTRPFRSGV